MNIKSTLVNGLGEVLDVVYEEDLDPNSNLNEKKLQGVHGFCFFQNKLLIVYDKDKNSWIVPGGGIEVGESYQEATIREIHEESNMKVLYQELIGYQDIYESDKTIRQTRSFCVVEPYGEFVSDPDGDITEIKLINPKDYKQYFDWGKIGERLMDGALFLKDKHLR